MPDRTGSPKPRLPLLVGGLLGVAALAALGVAPWQGGDEAARELRPDDAELVAEGAALYGQHCASCHGAALEGQPDWRQRNAEGRLPAPPHDETGHTWHHPDEQLFALTKQGPAALVGQGYESDMPGFEGVLSDREIVAVLSYIKSRWPAEIRERHDAMTAAQRR